MDLKTFARLLEEDFAKNWRHIYSVINEFRWEENFEEKLKLLEEPLTEDRVIKAICASLAEWLCLKDGFKPPCWTKKIGPAPQAVYFVPEGLSMRSFIKTPAAFKRRHVFINLSRETFKEEDA